MSEHDEAYADQVLHQALLASTAGLDVEGLTEAGQTLITAIQAQARRLADLPWDKEKSEVTARALSYGTKALDVIVRLAEFARGNPDSRPDLGTDWLRGLTEAQLRQVEAWHAEAPSDGGRAG